MKTYFEMVCVNCGPICLCRVVNIIKTPLCATIKEIGVYKCTHCHKYTVNVESVLIDLEGEQVDTEYNMGPFKTISRAYFWVRRLLRDTPYSCVV